ncbi:MAG TPA: Ni/Fe hydrogenase subunit gamma, partial [Chromatiales bacterium]|nr:Ni/Fe hydrogenase subunit gamma [Chromatiales bacterium]
MIPRPYRVVRQRRELRNVVTLTLEPQEGGRFRFQPGQFNMLYQFGFGEVPISISGNPAKRRLRHTIRAVGAVTHAMTRLKKGDVVGVRGPYGEGWPMAEAEGRDVVL